MKNGYIGLDIGTSGIKAVLFDHDGKQCGLESVECEIISSFEGMAEIDPEAVFHSAIAVMGSCIQKHVKNKYHLEAVGISCHMHSLLAVDKNGNPLGNAMIWADTRAKSQARKIEQNYDIGDLYLRTGCRVQHPMYPLSKLLWLKDNAPEQFKSAEKFITIKEYVLFKLFGEYIVDYTLAASQGFFNINTHKWDDFILNDILQLKESCFSKPVACDYILRGMKKSMASQLGIDAATPFVVGSGDGIMANVGCGVHDDTALSSTIGTSGAIRTLVKQPLLDHQMRTWCYSFTEDTWVAGGAINNGGIILKWLRETFRKQFEFDSMQLGENIYKLFDRFAAEIQPGSNGLIFLPYLTGERSPDWKAEVRGMMFGMDLSHSRKHIIRAAMEGVMYRLFSVYKVMEELNANAVQIRANGGYTKSDVWLAMQADIFNKEIHVSNVGEVSALGAAFTAMVAVGAVNSFKETLQGMKAVRVITPNQSNHEIYLNSYEKAMKLYEAVTN